MKNVKVALISVSDKTGLPEFARNLVELGFRIVSTGGTAAELRRAGIPVREVSAVTGYPEILGGRVKTLHPRIHAGILARRDVDADMSVLEQDGIDPIDLVVVNLYPFQATVESGAGIHETVEQIDIGGPTLLRAAAKNYVDVAVVVDPADYHRVVAELEARGSVTGETRLDLARKAFAHTSSYDSHIVAFMSSLDCCDGLYVKREKDEEAMPDNLHLALHKYQDLRYGENPHQKGAFYVEELNPGEHWAIPEQLQGKELSYNNFLDLDAAIGLVREFPECAAAVIKHGNPCGAALGASTQDAFLRALRTDPESAYGSIIAFNRPVDQGCAAEVANIFVEVVSAPDFTPEALEILGKKKNLRLLKTTFPTHDVSALRARGLAFGVLVQESDELLPRVSDLKVVTSVPVDADLQKDLLFAWTCVKHVRSNAIVIARDGRLLGIGAGQMSRVDSARLAVSKSRDSLSGAVLASDAFIPFRDTVDIAAEAGIRAIIQTGGSVRDASVIEAAEEKGIAMVFTGIRHFRH